MRILVTGGAGFIGSNFIRYLLNKYKEHEIINLDKLTYCGNLDNLKDIENNPKYRFVKGDICDKELVFSLTKDIDQIIHFAAESHVDVSIKNPFVFMQTNVLGTHILLEAARKNNIKKFIHISTDEVYGSIEKDYFYEHSPFKPNSPYSASKASADLLARSYYKTYNFPIIITRSSNNYGPYQYPEKIIPLFTTNLIEGKKVPVYGDGMNVRDWLYVEDNCEAIDFLRQNGELGQAYNIGGENEVSNIELTKKIIEHIGRDESYIEYVKDRPGHDKRYSLNIDKIKQIGWTPKHDFNQAIKNTVKWYKENSKWWQRIKTGEFQEYYKKHYQDFHQMESDKN